MWAFGYGIVPSLIFGFSGTIIQRFLDKLQSFFGCDKRKQSATSGYNMKDQSSSSPSITVGGEGSLVTTPSQTVRSYTPSDQDNSGLVQIEDF
jgi:hypothetical protein